MGIEKQRRELFEEEVRRPNRSASTSRQCTLSRGEDDAPNVAGHGPFGSLDFPNDNIIILI